jgi:hypothetical protein
MVIFGHTSLLERKPKVEEIYIKVRNYYTGIREIDFYFLLWTRGS